MATVPTVPSFVTGETPSIAKMNQLASCVSFINSAPAFAQLTSSATAFTTNTVTALSWAKVTDRDGGFSGGSPTRYTAQTPGYYNCDALVSFAANVTGDRFAYFQVTTGANNPGGAGHTTAFGGCCVQAAPSGVTNMTICQLSPYLYLLDYVEVYGYQQSGGNLNCSGWWQMTFESLGP